MGMPTDAWGSRRDDLSSSPRQDSGGGADAEHSSDVSPLCRHSYLSGLAGTAVILAMGCLGARRHVLAQGWGSSSSHLAQGEGAHGGGGGGGGGAAVVLLTCCCVMLSVELLVRLRVEGGVRLFFKVAPEVAERRYGRFLARCLLVYVVELSLLSLSLAFYRTASEYGFRTSRNGYYRAWFDIMDGFWNVYAVCGLPYVVATRMLQHEPRSDRRLPAFTLMKLAGLRLAAADGGGGGSSSWLSHHDKSAVLGVVVKAFFVPLMTVFFAGQFTHLVKNFEWMTSPQFSWASVSVRDVQNVLNSALFSVDCGLAWCGYVASSRWVKNTIISVEPTLEGWAVAVVCYPPINHLLGYYYSAPPEDGFLGIPNLGVVAFFATCSLLSFAVYVSATVMFGLRFSNLTHRGVVTTGPYALVRHPAYAAKNFSWWCIMLPHAVYSLAATRKVEPVLQIVGMVILSGLYYRRAVTEERHLACDGEYRAYMKKVPHRFWPGVV